MRFFSLALLLLLFTTPAWAASPVYHTTAALISPVTAAGKTETVPVAVHITLEKDWETYWRTPGEAGLAPVFDWTGSTNFKSASVRWPVPHRFTTFDFDNFGFAADVVFPLDITVADPGQPVALKLKLDILVCSKICLPETYNLSLNLPAGVAETSPQEKIYKAALKKIPEKQTGGFKFKDAYLTYDTANANYLVVESYASAAPAFDADLFVEHGSGIGFGRAHIDYDSAKGTLTFTAPVHDVDTLEKLSGKLAASPLTLTYASGEGGVEGTLPLSPPPADVQPLPALHPAGAVIPETANFLRIALFAFIGGLILNLMPCVLPVLSLKVLSVVSHGGKDSRLTIARNFSASALGILFSFWIIAAFLVSLKAAGETIGWGIQFQHPAFLTFLILSLLLFAANMWGLFEIPLPRFIAKHAAARHEHEPTLAGHFLTGAFATLLATPCSAPFLGTAIGFALSRDAGGIFAVFTMIGLGLAAPYLLLAFLPQVFRYMPKPGKWMVTLKKFLAVALAATALWLVSVLFSVTAIPALDDGWQPFSEAMIAPAVQDGKIVIVDVTADWCLTCKANKKFVLEQADIEEALSGPEILLLQADWTHRDESIAAYLQKFGRYGIPFNIVYGPGKPEGILLPELLTKKAVLDAIAEAAGE